MRFQVRVKIHEFEKYLDDLSDGNEGESDDFADGNDEPDPDGSKGAAADDQQQVPSSLKYLRKSSLSVIHMRKPREVDLFSPAALIKRAILSKLAIPPDDPVFRHEYNYILLKDRDFRKKIYSEIKACRSYYNNQKQRGKNFQIDEKVLRNLQKTY